LRLLKYVFKELLNSKKFSLLFVLNMSMGLTGLLALEGFKASIDQTIASKSKVLLGADFGLSARRPLSKKEKQVFFDAAQSLKTTETQMIEVFSMVKAVAEQRGERSRLVQVRAVENLYPFYGEIETSPKINSLEGLNAWVHPELLSQLNAAVGESLKVGSVQFKIQAVVTNDSASGFSSSVAPRLYINLRSLKKTELVQAGSVAWHSSLFKVEQVSGDKLDKIEAEVFKKIDSPEVKVFSHKKASQQLAGLVARLNDFLGLTSLVALFLAAIGAFFLMRSYFTEKTNQVAILMSLGLSPLSSFGFYLSQIFILGVVSTALASLLSILIVPVFGEVMAGLLPFEINFFIRPQTFLLGGLVGVLGSVLICLPLLVVFTGVKPVRLLTKGLEPRRKAADYFKTGFLSAPLFIFFVFLSVELSNSYKVGIAFTTALAVVVLILSLLSFLIFRKFKVKNLSLNWALRDLNRNKGVTTISFVSIGVGVLLLNLVPQVQKTIEADLMSPDRSNLPTYFMFDIQEEQVETLKMIVKSEDAELKNLSPSIRARLMSVNGKGFGKSLDLAEGAELTREQEREQRFRNRGFNLSYRAELDESETILEGPGFSGVYDEESDLTPEVSIEVRFAKRLGLVIGDVLEFEIDGVPFEGKIINKRAVKWSSFQPNFFIQFQPGALDLAPKTFVASVKSSTPAKKIDLQNSIVDELPNVSMVDVTRVVKRLLVIMGQMGWAFKFMSLLCILVGFIVIYSVSNHQASRRRWDVGLLKSLGAPFELIRNQFLWQFLLISIAACFFGVAISLGASYFISTYVFEASWRVYFLQPLLLSAGTLLVTTLVTYVAIRKTLAAKTVELFL